MSAMQQRTLELELLGYWHCGSGRSAGTRLDAVPEKDRTGLPYAPGRHLKGLLRHAVHRAARWGWLDDLPAPHGGPVADLETLLFGSINHDQPRDATYPGMLAVADGKLPEDEYQYLAHPEQRDLVPGLYRDLQSTAIDADGVASDKSLRGLEATLPVRLHAPVAMEATALDDALRAQQQTYLEGPGPWTALERALPLIDAIGASRTRGLGEAVATFHA